MTGFYLSLENILFSLRNLSPPVQIASGPWAVMGTLRKTHEAPWIPSFCKQPSRTRHCSCYSWRRTNWGRAERGDEEAGSQFWFLIFYFHGFRLLSSGSEPTQQMEPFTPPLCLVYTRRDAQKPRQKTLLSENAKRSSLTFLPTWYSCGCDLGLQKNPVTCFCILHYALVNKILLWYIH